MKLLKLKAENIFSLGKVEVDLKNRGLVLITGYSEDEGSSNGAGKSSISTKAITWALFGKIVGDISAAEVVNRHAGGKGFAELDFIDNHGNQCKIIRTRGKNSSLKFVVEGGDVSARNAKDTQKAIELAIGRDFKSFIETDYFGQSKELGYASLAPKQQKEVLEQLLPLDRLDAWADFAKEESKKLIEEEEIKATAVREASLKLKSAEGQLSFTETESESWERDKNAKIAKAQVELNGLTSVVSDLSLIIEEKQIEISNLVFHNEEELNLRLKDLQDRIFKSVEKISSLKPELSNLKGKINEPILAECKVCGHTLSKEKVKELEEGKEELKKKAQETALKMKTLECEQKNIHSEISGVKDLLSEHERNQTKKNILLREVENLNSSNSIKKANELEVLINTTEALINPHLNTISHIKKEIKKFEEEKEVLEKERQDFEDLVEKYLHWANAFNRDLKLKLFEAACPFLDEKTAYYLGALGNDQIRVEFSTIKHLSSGETKEDFSVRVSSETGGSSYGSLSGGEKKMVSFSIGLALADLAATQTSGSTDFMILDEPFEQLDERNSEAMVNYLNEVSNKATILLISNEEHLKQLVPTRIHVVKKGGITNVV